MWGLVDNEVELTWDQLNGIGQVSMHNDIHCVTGWSKFDNDWVGVPVLDVLAKVGVKPDATAVMVHSYGEWRPDRSTTWNRFSLIDQSAR